MQARPARVPGRCRLRRKRITNSSRRTDREAQRDADDAGESRGQLAVVDALDAVVRERAVGERVVIGVSSKPLSIGHPLEAVWLASSHTD